MAFIPKALFPNVPKLPGVPQLRRSLQFPAGPPPVLGVAVALGRLWQAIFSQPTWGIYDTDDTNTEENTVTVTGNLKPVVQPDSFRKFEYRQEWSVTSAPVQEGGFVNYNKVNNPFELTLRMIKTGSKSDRAKFLQSIDAIGGTTKLYKILTPERTYFSCNVTGYRIVREEARGAYFLSEVEISFIEIRTTQAEYTATSIATQNAKTDSAKPVENQGAVNGQPLTTVVGGAP